MKMKGAAYGGRLKGVRPAFCHFGGALFRVRGSGALASMGGVSGDASTPSSVGCDGSTSASSCSVESV